MTSAPPPAAPAEEELPPGHPSLGPLDPAKPWLARDKWYLYKNYLQSAHALPLEHVSAYVRQLHPVIQKFVENNWERECGNCTCAAYGGRCGREGEWFPEAPKKP